MSLPSPDQSRRRLAVRAASQTLERHQRRCHVCRQAPRSLLGLCERGRELLYALQAAVELALQA